MLIYNLIFQSLAKREGYLSLLFLLFHPPTILHIAFVFILSKMFACFSNSVRFLIYSIVYLIFYMYMYYARGKNI